MRILSAAIAALALTAIAGAAPAQQTARGTIGDRNGDNRLEYGPADPRVVRTDLGGSVAGIVQPILSFAHLADTQMVDEESPGRVELVDFIGGSPFGSAYRPQEGLMPFVLNEQVRAVRSLRRGPATGAPIAMAITGGDNVDNAQLNETRWFIDVLDGGLVNPDSGRPRTCGLKRPPRYTGMRGGGRFYEPNGRGDGPGYSASQAANRRAVLRSVASRDYPGLFEQMNRPFRAVGLGVPWFTVFGNHDGLVQGNFAQNSLFGQIVVGCRKVTRYSREALAQIRPLLEGGVTREEREQIIRITFGDYLDTWGVPQEHRGLWKAVPRDPSRRFLNRSAWMREHFRTRGAPRGHGFTEANVSSGQAYYSFVTGAGVRFVVLDTVADDSDSGNLDEAQLRWLEAQLATAETRRDLVLVFGHHSIRTITAAESGTRLGSELDVAPTPPPRRDCLHRRP